MCIYMNPQIILFSPVSDRDPCSTTKSNPTFYRDGALLHIVRQYHPDKVYLFLTQRFRNFEDKDHRFTKLLKHLNPNVQIEMIDCPDTIQNVAEFDQFDTPFHDYLEKIHLENPDAQLLINISSGTPQMQSALYLLAATLNFPVKPIQVMSPEKDSNAVDRYKFDLEKDILAEDGTECRDKDGNPVFYTENRCREVKCINAIRTVLSKNIQQLVSSYDYTAALDLYKSAQELFDNQLNTLLQTAIAHIGLNHQQMQTSDNSQTFYEPALLSADPEVKKCYDYLLYMGTLVKRSAFNDFSRAISPALMTVMQLRLKAAGFDIAKFCYTDHFGVVKLSNRNIAEKEPEFLDYLNNQYKGAFRDGPLTANHMLLYMQYLQQSSADSPDFHLSDFEKLRAFEAAIRNFAAHTMEGITDQDIYNKTPDHLHAADYLRLLQQEFAIAAKASDLKWDALEKLNAHIFQIVDIIPGR